MTKAKNKKNSGCANCDFYTSQIYFHGHHRGDRCQNEKGYVEEHDPISGQYKMQTWVPKEQNKNCECPGFSDIEKKKKAADEAEKKRIIAIIEEYNKEVEDKKNVVDQRNNVVDQRNIEFVDMNDFRHLDIQVPKFRVWEVGRYFLFILAGCAAAGGIVWSVLEAWVVV